MRVGSAPALQPRTFLAFDFGTRRVGVASGNTLTRSATPLCTIDAEGEARFAAIAALIGDWQPAALVVGVPFHPDGATHANTARARRFARKLAERLRLPVHEVDERYTTTAAAALSPTLSREPEPGQGGIDARAAAIILEQYLAGMDA